MYILNYQGFQKKVEASYIPPAIKGLEPPTLTVFLHKQNTQIATYFKSL
jgi:hypothetical protein